MESKVCPRPECGVTFFKKEHQKLSGFKVQKYCSRSCAARAIAPRATVHTKLCIAEGCGKEFVTRNKRDFERQRFCSKQCCNLTIKRTYPPTEKTCPQCSTVFITKSKRKEFCKRTCTNQWKRKQYWDSRPPVPPRVCQWEPCGKQFERREGESNRRFQDRKYCTIDCRMAKVRSSSRGSAASATNRSRMIMPKLIKQRELPPVQAGEFVRWVPPAQPVQGRYVTINPRDKVVHLTQAQRTERRARFRETWTLETSG